MLHVIAENYDDTRRLTIRTIAAEFLVVAELHAREAEHHG